MWQSPHSERTVSLEIGGNRSSAIAPATAAIEKIADATPINLFPNLDPAKKEGHGIKNFKPQLMMGHSAPYTQGTTQYYPRWDKCSLRFEETN
jgi:hypothetical protein